MWRAVARFVKYTGYENAAGLLAQRGLMCGGKSGEYSSESDDSDTDEYSQLAAGYAQYALVHVIWYTVDSTVLCLLIHVLQLTLV